jgi:hypothetical protein
MTKWHEPYLGMTSIPEDLSTMEVEGFFTLEPHELVAIRTFRSPPSRLGAALQRGFIQLTGTTLAEVDRIPRVVLQHLAQQLGDRKVSIASLRSLYARRPATLYDHQKWAKDLLKFTELGPKRDALVGRLRVEARSALAVDALVDFAKSWSYQHRVLMPTERILRSLASGAFDHAEQEILAEVQHDIPESVRKLWLKALTSKPTPGIRSRAEWLDRGPKKGPRKGFGDQIDKLEYLRSLRVHEFGVHSDRKTAPLRA